MNANVLDYLPTNKFVAAVVFTRDPLTGKRITYSYAAANERDFAGMRKNFYTPNGFTLAVRFNLPTLEDATYEAQAMYWRACREYGFVEKVQDMSHTAFKVGK